jgi:transcriptional regulator with XRE-family HTH domain
VAPPASNAGADQPIPELLRLGEEVARARQAAGLSEDELASRLRLEPRQLKALEAGDHTRLPEGVFVVALARRVADALHSDLEEAIVAVRQSPLMRRERPERTAAPNSEAPWRPSPAGPSTASKAPHVPALSRPGRFLLAALLAAGAMAAAWLLSPHRLRGLSPTPKPEPTQAQSPAAAPAQTPAPVASDNLRLSASEPSWVEVREVNGRSLFEGTLTGEQRFPIGHGIEVIAGRPHAVRASVGPGPGAPLGGVADIRWKRFSPGNLPPPSPASALPSR